MAKRPKKKSVAKKKVIKKKKLKKVVKLKKAAKKVVKKKPPKKSQKKRPVQRLARPPAKKPALRSLPSFKGLSLRQVAAVIGAHLASRGHDPVLVGKACANVYGGEAIKVKTIEFVIKDYALDSVALAMEAVGFKLRDYRTFASDRCPFEIMLTPAPIMVGDDHVDQIGMVRTARGELRVLTPTDAVRNRLTKYYRFGERDAFDEAVRVARRHKVDMDLVRRWSDWEWCGDKFEEFALAVEQKR